MSHVVNPQSPPQVQKQLTSRVDALRKELSQLRKDFQASTGRTQLAVDHVQNSNTTNNLVFTWTGGSLTMSWANGYINNPKLNTTSPVLAGSTVLLASTFYWAVWNIAQRKMTFTTDVNKALQILHNVPVCQLFTGTSGQSGVAGGGGSETTSAPSGIRYKNF